MDGVKMKHHMNIKHKNHVDTTTDGFNRLSDDNEPEFTLPCSTFLHDVARLISGEMGTALLHMHYCTCACLHTLAAHNSR